VSIRRPLVRPLGMAILLDLMKAIAILGLVGYGLGA
jgi:hypothetical protein